VTEPVTEPAARYSPAQLARLLGAAPPTAEQAAVIGAPLAPMAVIAGAGSGKSETMAARLVWLVANQLVRPERVLGLTFTRKAAAELGERVRTRLDGLHRAGLAGPATGEQPGEPTVSTYHAYAGRLVADHALREGLEPSMRLVTPAVSWQIAARVVAAYAGPMDAVSWAPATVTAAVIDLAGELAEHLRTADDVLAVGRSLDRRLAELPGRIPALALKVVRCQAAREQLLPLVAAYHAAKAAREVIDYGDQMAIAARIAARHPEVGAGERGRYQVVLLDEYQDTSHAQLVLLRSLFGGGHPVTAVGDPCQSIYGWRGATAGNLRRFSADFPAAEERPAPVLLLSTSFRNTGRVLAAAGSVQAGLRAAAPEVPLLVAPPGRAGRGQVVCALLESSGAEAAWVAAQVGGLLSLEAGIAPDGSPWLDGRADAVRPSDVAVLCRKRAQFPALRAALEARGIPVEVVGLGGLLTVPEVADIVATLRVLHDPTASDALARILTSPRWRIGPADLVALGRRARALAGQANSAAGGAAGRGVGGAGGGGAVGGGAGGGGAGGEGAGGEGAGGEGAGGEGAGGEGAGGGGQASNAAGAEVGLLAQAVTDLTKEMGSLIEALDDLDGPAAYSPAGHARLAALATELRSLRGHVARPLPDLVSEVERTLCLDIEVASRPGVDPASARADLDAFTDAAAAFAGDREEPTLGAFLAYLSAAEEEEFGLEGGRIGETDSVKLATVHAAKGLQWPAVIVPGLAGGAQSRIFPAKPKVATRWTENPRLLPFSLRGDAADLPALAGLAASDLAIFTQACTDRELAEERRLAYVAATRAAFWLGCTGYWWGDGVSRLGPSEFLEEVRAECEGGAGVVDAWEPEPEPDATNPALAEPATAAWPATAAAGARYDAIRAAADLVTRAMTELERRKQRPERHERAVAAARAAATARSRRMPEPPPGPEPERGVGPDPYQELIDSWASEADLLLAERARRRAGGHAQVALPRQIPVSALVTVARDPAELAQQVRRPMPRPPAPHALRGTEFHRWLEERFGQPQLIDADELPGAADDPGSTDPDADLTELKAAFEASEWAGRQPSEVEVPFESLIGDRLVRGRIDAVFADAPDGRFDVVDWKTGRPPGSAAERRAVAVQLAAYRLAWAALAGVPVGDVRAAFYYVRGDLTVRPADLMDEGGLAALIDGIPAADAAASHREG
jgi:DNA helicase II / ATP-dependent DNA helicase PcrA